MTDFVPFLLGSTELVAQFAFLISWFDGSQTFDDSLLLLEVLLLFAASVGSCLFLCLEECVASGIEALPYLVAVFLWYSTYLAPFLLEFYEDVAGLLPCCAVLERLCLLYESQLSFVVLVKTASYTLEVFCLLLEVLIASGTEPLEYLHVHLLRSKAYSLPLCLQLCDFLTLLIPLSKGLQCCSVDGFYLLADFSLLLQILFFLLLASLEVFVVLLVDDG